MKMDLLNKALKFIDHERGKVVGLAVAIIVVLCVWGCEVKLTSPFSDKKVTAQQFEAEVQFKKVEYENKLNLINAEMQQFLTNAEITQQDFAKWEEFKKGAFDIIAGIVTNVAGGGAVNTSQVIASLISLGGIGMAAGGLYDSNRKNKIIEQEKAKNQT